MLISSENKPKDIQQDEGILTKIQYLVGAPETIIGMKRIAPRVPFHKEVLDFLDQLSKELMKQPDSRKYPDVVTFAFWIRKASIMSMVSEFSGEDKNVLHMGRGVSFHIAPSNVPVNFAYSMVTALLTGNAAVVRVPSKEFVQVTMIAEGIQKVLKEYLEMQSYICLVRYGRDKDINDYLSDLCDIRIVWGGDHTIQELRQSTLRPRASEITFADRFSISVIDADIYLGEKDAKRTAMDFYNDTFLTDQNACTSPILVAWTGIEKEKAKNRFWQALYEVVKEQYVLQDIQAINKLANSYLLAADKNDIKIERVTDNRIVRIKMRCPDPQIVCRKDNGGYFFEYDLEDILELREICDDNRLQTISYIGNKEMFRPLVKSGIRGIDRIVPVGHTMDFGLWWDGYNLYERMTRGIVF